MKMFLLFILLLPLSAAVAADYTAKAGTTLKTDIEIPEAKIGGGEFEPHLLHFYFCLLLIS